MRFINRFWREQLTTEEKELYDRMYKSFQAEQYDVNCNTYNHDQIMNIYNSLLNDCPELFYLPAVVRIQGINSFFEKKISIYAEPIYSPQEIQVYKKELVRVQKEIDKLVNNCQSDFEKEKVICSYIVENCVYEADNHFNMNAARALIDKKGQCSGISRAAKYLFDYVGIECILVMGTGFNGNEYENHAWNIVKIDGDYYQLDITFMLSFYSGKIAGSKLAYFNYSDDQMLKNHQWDNKFYPKCYKEMNKDYANELCDEGSKIIYSLYELKKEIHSFLDNNNSEIQFISKIKVSNDDEFRKLVFKSIEMAVKNYNFKLDLLIGIQGEIITVKVKNR